MNIALKDGTVVNIDENKFSEYYLKSLSIPSLIGSSILIAQSAAEWLEIKDKK